MNRWFRYEIDFLNGLKMAMFLGVFCACLLYPLYVCAEEVLTYSKTLPVLFVNTDNQQPIESKEEYVNGTYYIETYGHNGYENIGSQDAPLALQIRYRGNWTLANFEKKPYRLKFGEKTSILGLKKNKHFALLAHADAHRGFLRNTVGFEISKKLGMDFTPEQRPIEFVLNGSYEGLYFLTETIRVDKNRLDIGDQKDLEEDPYKIENGGWLVEIDNYEAPHQIVFDVSGTRLPHLRITYHSPEQLSDTQFEFLKSQFEDILNILRVRNYDGLALFQMIDCDELAKYYLCSEIIDHQEAFEGSCYIHKDKGGKWRFGPVWDFGTAFIEYQYHEKDKFIFEDNVFGNAGLLEELKDYPIFMQTVQNLYRTFRENYYEGLFPFIDNFAQEIKEAAKYNYQRWPQYGNDDVIERADYVKDCLHKKIAFLDANWGGQYSNLQTLQSSTESFLFDLYGRKYNFAKGHLSKGVYIMRIKDKTVKKIVFRQ